MALATGAAARHRGGHRAVRRHGQAQPPADAGRGRLDVTPEDILFAVAAAAVMAAAGRSGRPTHSRSTCNSTWTPAEYQPTRRSGACRLNLTELKITPAGIVQLDNFRPGPGDSRDSDEEHHLDDTPEDVVDPGFADD